MPISSSVVVMTAAEFDGEKRKSFLKGVERGRQDERMVIRGEPIAYNCKHWKDGYCEMCGAQTQMMQVGPEWRCPRFEKRATRGPVT